MAEAEEKTKGTSSSNREFNHFTALQIRLDTSSVMNEIKDFLGGETTDLYVSNDGKIVEQSKSIGEPLANQIGRQCILSQVRAIFNSQVVQGNFEMQQYEQYIYEINVNLVESLIINCERWEIEPDNIDVITNFIMSLAVPFCTRMIDNLEREGYKDTIRTVESNTLQQKNGIWPFGQGR